VEFVELPPGDARFDDVYPVLHELRTDLTRDEFDRRYAEGYPDGYRMVALFDENSCRAVGGYRIMTNVVRGRVLYIDDLVTSAAYRSRGYGKAINDYLRAATISRSTRALGGSTRIASTSGRDT
jgi:hypothetical protein